MPPEQVTRFIRLGRDCPFCADPKANPILGEIRELCAEHMEAVGRLVEERGMTVRSHYA